MDIREAAAYFGLIARARSTRNNVAGTMAIGIDDTTVTLPTENAVFYSVRLTMGDGATPTLDLATGTVTGATAGTAHVETATASGTATSNGNVTVTITDSAYPACNKAITVAILNGDTASAWAAKVRAALTADADISANYAVSGSGADIVLTQLVNDGDEAMFNIALANGSPSPGITPDATSTTTTPGVPRVVVEDDSVTFEGKTPPALIVVSAVGLSCAGGVVITQGGGTGSRLPTLGGTTAEPGWHQFLARLAGLNAFDPVDALEIEAVAPSTVLTIIVHGTTA